MNNVVPKKLQISSNRKVKNLQTMSLSEKVLVTTSVFSPPGVNFMNINRSRQKTLIKFIDGSCLFDPVLFLYTIFIYIILLTGNMFGKSIIFWCNVIYIKSSSVPDAV